MQSIPFVHHCSFIASGLSGGLMATAGLRGRSPSGGRGKWFLVAMVAARKARARVATCDLLTVSALMPTRRFAIFVELTGRAILVSSILYQPDVVLFHNLVSATLVSSMFYQSSDCFFSKFGPPEVVIRAREIWPLSLCLSLTNHPRLR